MATLQGDLSIVWGCAVTGITYTGSGSLNQESESWNDECDTVEIKDKTGEVIGLYHYNYRHKLSLSVIPAGSSVNVVLPSIGQKITTVCSADTKLAGDWVVSAVSQERKVDGIVSFKIDATKFDGVTVT